MRIIGLAGWSGSGKTTLITSVIPVLVKRGLKIATVKHAHHEFDIDTSSTATPSHCSSTCWRSSPPPIS
jgi:molybdopterin-guanine dinucleotide biosynthesis protein B